MFKALLSTVQNFWHWVKVQAKRILFKQQQEELHRQRVSRWDTYCEVEDRYGLVPVPSCTKGRKLYYDCIA